MSPKWNNYPIYPDSGDSLSANMHPVLIKHACVLKAKLLLCVWPLGVFWELKQKQGPGYIGDREMGRPWCCQGLIQLREAGVDML